MSSPITALFGVGKRRAETLAKLGIETIEDLLRHYPFRYEDRRRPVTVGALKDGEESLVRVRVRRVIRQPAAARGARMSRIPMKVICGDESGEMTLLYFNARWMSGVFREGAEYWVYGTAHRDLAGVSMAHPEIESIQQGDAEAGEGSSAGTGIVPVYPLTAGISQKYLRGLVRAAIPSAVFAQEVLPEGIIKERRLAPIGYALEHIHFPADEHALHAARYRLVYEELFLFQARMFCAGRTDAADTGIRTIDGRCTAEDAAAIFPYELTGAQLRVIEEVYADMAGLAPMRRLLQGDVGSGKTAVAAAAAFFAAKGGFQTAIMAPTEILAAQHFNEFSRFFKDTGVSVCLLTSGLSPAQKRETKEGLKSGEKTIAIGTHALIEPDISFSNLGLVVTDEQHRFGVRQRLRLREKGKAPETLVMTATPIPRTLALMLYADLDLSVLDEMPPGRKPVTTRFINSGKRDDAYDFAERVMASGRQVYVVAPSIGNEDDCEAETALDRLADDASPLRSSLSVFAGTRNGRLASALDLAEEMTERFPHRRVAVLHGRMKGEKKEEIMLRFAAGGIDMLVSTVVIEVGVNVPNATMMIIENADRFGLAGLHQLRGRVGRGAAKSYCVLISDADTELAVKRCETIAGETDGFKIAELDMELRGSGDLFGVRQHGLMEFKLADPAKHIEILQMANRDAQAVIARDPDLSLPEHARLRSMIGEGYGNE